MRAIERFQNIQDYIDTRNICDLIPEFLEEEELNKFCDMLEEEYNIEYEEFYNEED
jgi:hypothetical protein